jgi:hypothetical protein
MPHTFSAYPGRGASPRLLREEHLHLETRRPVGAELGFLDVVIRRNAQVERELSDSNNLPDAGPNGYQPRIVVLLEVRRDDRR